MSKSGTLSDCESVSGSEISDCESELGDEIPINSDHDIDLLVQRMFGINSETVICEKNVDTFEQTVETVKESVANWSSSIAYVRDEFITYDLYELAVVNDEHSIRYVKPHLITKEEYYNLCLIAASGNGWTMKYIPQEIQTQELVDEAIESICWAIQFCLDEFKTRENCLSAVSRNGQTIQYVPREFIDRELCLAAAAARYPCLNLIPKEFIDKELCHIAVGADGADIKNVPDEFMSSELGWLAITSPAPSNPSSDMAGSNVQYIAAKYLTKEIIVESAKRWYCTYARVPKECITEEIEDAVLDVSPYCIQFMKQTPERWLRALKVSPYVIENKIEEGSINKEVAEYFFSLEDRIKNRISDKTLDYLKTFL